MPSVANDFLVKVVYMTLCIDFSAIKSGGGLQLASSFLEELPSVEFQISAVIVPVGSALEARVLSKSSKYGVIGCPAKLGKRLLFEKVRLGGQLKKYSVNKVFTFFGAGVPHSSRVRSVVSVAYPIICYPDSPYWENVPYFDKARQRVVNAGRVARLARFADLIVAETTVMANRLRNTRGLASKDIVVVPPAVSTLVAFKENPCPPVSPVCRFLFLAGLSAHKNLWRLPDIARRMLEEGESAFCFAITSSKADFMNYCVRMGVSCLSEPLLSSHFLFLGLVSPGSVTECVDASHYVANLSDLESFTNNYMEAWRRGRPLIASDRDFAKDLLGSAATYLEPHDREAAVRVFINAVHEFESNYQSLIEARQALLSSRTVTLRERVRRIGALL